MPNDYECLSQVLGGHVHAPRRQTSFLDGAAADVSRVVALLPDGFEGEADGLALSGRGVCFAMFLPLQRRRVSNQQ